MYRKDYDLLQEGEDWVVLSWNPLSESFLKTVTFHYDSWGAGAENAARDYILQRKMFTRIKAEVFGPMVLEKVIER